MLRITEMLKKPAAGRKISSFAAGLACLALLPAFAGCGSMRFGDNNPPPPAAPAPQPGAPLSAVSQSDLPPPPGTEQPANTDLNNSGSAIAAAGVPAAAPMGAVDLTPASVAGVWKADLGGMSCQLATPQTKAGQGYRAGAIHCPAVFAQIGSWNINGKQLVFYDKSGRNLATLYSTGANGFSGQTNSGMPVSLSR